MALQSYGPGHRRAFLSGPPLQSSLFFLSPPPRQQATNRGAKGERQRPRPRDTRVCLPGLLHAKALPACLVPPLGHCSVSSSNTSVQFPSPPVCRAALAHGWIADGHHISEEPGTRRTILVLKERGFYTSHWTCRSQRDKKTARLPEISKSSHNAWAGGTQDMVVATRPAPRVTEGIRSQGPVPHTLLCPLTRSFTGWHRLQNRAATSVCRVDAAATKTGKALA